MERGIQSALRPSPRTHGLGRIREGRGTERSFVTVGPARHDVAAARLRGGGLENLAELCELRFLVPLHLSAHQRLEDAPYSPQPHAADRSHLGRAGVDGSNLPAAVPVDW